KFESAPDGIVRKKSPVRSRRTRPISGQERLHEDKRLLRALLFVRRAFSGRAAKIAKGAKVAESPERLQAQHHPEEGAGFGGSRLPTNSDLSTTSSASSAVDMSRCAMMRE